MIRSIWMRLSLILLLGIGPELLFQSNLQRQNLGLVFDLMDHLGLDPLLQRHMDIFKEFSSKSPESQGRLHEEFQATVKIKAEMTTLVKLRETLLDEFSRQSA